jgi:hypothetical protein
MSKFKDILSAAKDIDNNQPKENQDQTIQISQKENKVTKKGRSKGKRSNPDFEQVTAYVRKDTYRQTKITLLNREDKLDFSDLVEQLLTEWLSTQKSENANL